MLGWEQYLAKIFSKLNHFFWMILLFIHDPFLFVTGLVLEFEGLVWHFLKIPIVMLALNKFKISL